MKPRYRADQVGSLLRPAHLLEARARHQSGALPVEELRRIEDAAILDLLRMQKDVGIPIFSDGELRREAWQTGFSDAVDGFVADHRTIVWTDRDGNKAEEPSYSKVIGARLRSRRRITGDESAFLKENAAGPYKITMPSPLVMTRQSFKPGVTDVVYPDPDALLVDVLEVMKAELRALLGEGVPYIQIDEGFTGFVGDAWRGRAREQGHDPDAMIARAVAGENELYDSIDRSGTILAIHICRGNSRSRWTQTGSYDALAEQVFGGLHVDRFLLEYDSDRAGGFEALRFVPDGKIAVLGLISTKTGALEAEDELMRRIEEAARYAPIERLALSPQCGFASVKDGNDITADDQRRKLELTVRVAERVWRTVG
jgi:5-methyltetrahydropteroyltriglutamate--homocysteine methyltransferase